MFSDDLKWAVEQQKKLEPFYKDKFESTEIVDDRVRKLLLINRIAYRKDGSKVKIKETFSKRKTENLLIELSVMYGEGFNSMESPSWFYRSVADILVQVFVEPDKLTVNSFKLPELQCWYKTEGKNRCYKEHTQISGAIKTINVLIPMKDIEAFRVFKMEELK